MNNAKLWLVVKPTVGVPLFLSAVAIGSFAVHLSVMNYTTWLPEYYAGATVTKQSDVAMTGNAGSGANAVVVFDGATLTSAGSGQQGVVVLPDGRTARVVFDEPKIVDGTKTALLQ